MISITRLGINLKIIFKNIFRTKSFSFLNLLGLSMSFALSILIIIYVKLELTYDEFIPDHEKIYRIEYQGNFNENIIDFATSPAPFLKTVINEYPTLIENGVRVIKGSHKLVSYGERRYPESKFFYSDAGFFDFFGIEIEEKRTQNTLNQKNTVVITRETSNRYFGDEPALGKVLNLDNGFSYEVVGVCENIPQNTHLKFDFVASLKTIEEYFPENYYNHYFYTYIKLFDPYSKSVAEDKLKSLFRKNLVLSEEESPGLSNQLYGSHLELHLKNIADIHFGSESIDEIEPGGNKMNIVLFLIIAILILVISAINFMNLATAQSYRRIKEVSVRKTMGSSKLKLFLQFMIESLAFSVIGVLFSLAIIEMGLPLFNSITKLELDVSVLGNFNYALIIALIALIFAIAAGGYPAYYLSVLKPAESLRYKLFFKKNNIKIRNALVIIQFVIAVFLFSMFIIVFRQVEFLNDKDLGFEKDDILVIRRGYAIKEREKFKQDVMQIKGVENVSASFTLPGNEFMRMQVTVDNSLDFKNEMFIVSALPADYNYQSTFGVEMMEGSYFQSASTLKNENDIVINQSAVNYFGFENPIGEILKIPEHSGEKLNFFRVVGVCKDFHFEDLHRKIKPLIIYNLKQDWYAAFISVKLTSAYNDQTFKKIENIWQQYSGEQPFEYYMLEDGLSSLYDNDINTRRIVMIFALLSLIIAIVGLKGLIIFTVEQDKKNIGVKRAFGSSHKDIFKGLLRSFSVKIIIANVIAWPLTYFFADQWLNYFAYRQSLDIWPFLGASIVITFLAMMSVYWQLSMVSKISAASVLKYE